MDALEVDAELLITQVSIRPVLWDKSLEEYKSRTETAAAWREVFKELNSNFEELNDEEKSKYGKAIIAKWTNIRDRHVKYLKKLDEGKGTGSAAKSTKKYIYSDQLGFLQKNTKRQQTTSSMDSETEIEHDDGNSNPSTTDDETFRRPSSPQPSSQVKKKAKRGATSDIDKMILQKLQEPEDRHLNFFKGILPSLQTLNESETIKFQSEVLKTLENIYKSRSAAQHPQWFSNQQSNASSNPNSFESQYFDQSTVPRILSASVQHQSKEPYQANNNLRSQYPVRRPSSTDSAHSTRSNDSSHSADSAPGPSYWEFP